jgi:hypothetical protein
MTNDNEIDQIEGEILKHRQHLEAILRVEAEFAKSLQEAALATYLNSDRAVEKRGRVSDLLDTIFYNRVLSFRIRDCIKDLELAKGIKDLELAKGSKYSKKRARGEGG